MSKIGTARARALVACGALALILFTGSTASAQIVPPDGHPISAEPQRLCLQPGPSVVDNGDFEAGDVGFTSLPGQLGAGWNAHGVLSAPSTVVGSWKGTNHTTTGSLFLVVDADTTAGTVSAWSQPVGVLGGATYTFVAWALNLYTTTTSPTVRLAIRDGSGGLLSSGPWTQITGTSPNWQPLSLTWTAPGADQTVVLHVELRDPRQGGHDLGLDDISFIPCCGDVSAAFAIDLDACSNRPLAVQALGQAPGSVHQWQVAQADAQGNPVTTWGSLGKGPTPDVSWFDFTPGECWVIRQRVRNACGQWFEETRSFCVPEIVGLPAELATDELCERICCEDGEEFFHNRCGCGCLQNVEPCRPDLRLDKRLVSADVGGSTTVWTFEIQVTNVSRCPAAGPTTVDDLLPPGLVPVSAGGEGWSCPATGTQEIACTYGQPLAAGETTTLHVLVEVTDEAHANLENCAEVSSFGDWRPENDRSCVDLPCPDGGACGVEYESQDQQVCARLAADPPCPDGWFWGACGCGCEKAVDPSKVDDPDNP